MKTNREQAIAMMKRDYRNGRQPIGEVENSLRETEAIIDFVLAEFDEAVDKLRNEYELSYLMRRLN